MQHLINRLPGARRLSTLPRCHQFFIFHPVINQSQRPDLDFIRPFRRLRPDPLHRIFAAIPDALGPVLEPQLTTCFKQYRPDIGWQQVTPRPMRGSVTRHASESLPLP